jgi:hypothetical protein
MPEYNKRAARRRFFIVAHAVGMEGAMERDVARFDDATSTFEKTALVLGFVNLLLAIWARAPALQINPGSAVGLSVAGFNVGYAIVYGPLIATLTLAVYASILFRRDLLRRAILTDPKVVLSPGDRLVLDGFQGTEGARTGRLADRGWRTLWYFVVPPAAAFILLLRFCDFVPDGAAKAWGFWGRVGFLFFSSGGWERRPLLPAHSIEAQPDLMDQLPYIYAPLESWMELLLFVLACWLAWYAARLYFGGNGAMPAPAAPAPSVAA